MSMEEPKTKTSGESRRDTDWRIRQSSSRLLSRTIDKNGDLLKMKRISALPKIANQTNQISIIETMLAQLGKTNTTVDLAQQFFRTRNIQFMFELKRRINLQDYSSFVSQVRLSQLSAGDVLIEKGKQGDSSIILLDGGLASYDIEAADTPQQVYIKVYHHTPGDFLPVNQVLHKFNAYTVIATCDSCILKIHQDTFNRYLKKIFQKDREELSLRLIQSTLFRGLPAVEINKYLPYCFTKRCRYNECIYLAGQSIEEAFFIVEGQVEVCIEESRYKLRDKTVGHFFTLQEQPRKEIKLVRLSSKEIFGLEFVDLDMSAKHVYSARTVSTRLMLIVIPLSVLRLMQLENACVQGNLKTHLGLTGAMHNHLRQTNQRISCLSEKALRNKAGIKRRKKNKKKKPLSFEWWGLVDNLAESKRYKLPKRPKQILQTRKQPLTSAEKGNLSNKIDQLKRKVLEDELQDLQQFSQTEDSPYQYSYVPKLHKIKAKPTDCKPKPVDNTVQIKQKLLQYAKDDKVFCNELQLD